MQRDEAERVQKIMKRINCRGAAMEACVTRHGTIVAPLMTELVGFKELTPYKGGWCGNEIFAETFTPQIRRRHGAMRRSSAHQLLKEGYKGYFELDYLIDTGQRRDLPRRAEPPRNWCELHHQPRGVRAERYAAAPFHTLEWMNVPYTN